MTSAMLHYTFLESEIESDPIHANPSALVMAASRGLFGYLSAIAASSASGSSYEGRETPKIQLVKARYFENPDASIPKLVGGEPLGCQTRC